MSQTHTFGSGSFTNELWIAQKKVFPGLKSANVEFLTPGACEWLIAAATGAVVKTVRHDGGGWTSIDLASLGIFGDHSLGFRSVSPGEKKIRGGDVTFG